MLSGNITEGAKRFFAVKLLEKDDKIHEQLENVPDVSAQIKRLEDKFDDDTESIITNERYQYISEVIKGCYKKKNKEKKQTDGKKPNKESSLKKIKSKIKSLKETKVNLDKMPWREWLELGKDVLIRFLKHALPGQLEGNIAFGTGNPEYTGYITGIAAVFYPKYGEHFSLYSDFERKMFEAKCRGRGRIRLGYMLVLAVSILKEESVRTMIKNIILG